MEVWGASCREEGAAPALIDLVTSLRLRCSDLPSEAEVVAWEEALKGKTNNINYLQHNTALLILVPCKLVVYKDRKAKPLRDKTN